MFHGPAEKKHIFYHNKNSEQAGELDFTYFNAPYARWKMRFPKSRTKKA